MNNLQTWRGFFSAVSTSISALLVEIGVGSGDLHNPLISAGREHVSGLPRHRDRIHLSLITIEDKLIFFPIDHQKSVLVCAKIAESSLNRM